MEYFNFEFPLKQIRKRQSYNYWKKLYLEIQYPLTAFDILDMIFREIDEYHGFKYATNAFYAKESLELFKHDIENGLLISSEVRR
jgi:hypothetical protein